MIDLKITVWWKKLDTEMYQKNIQNSRELKLICKTSENIIDSMVPKYRKWLTTVVQKNIDGLWKCSVSWFSYGFVGVHLLILLKFYTLTGHIDVKKKKKEGSQELSCNKTFYILKLSAFSIFLFLSNDIMIYHLLWKFNAY